MSRTKEIFKLLSNIIAISFLLTVLGSYAHSYFVRNSTSFCVDFNGFGEAIIEMILLVIAIAGTFYYFFNSLKI